MRTLRPLKLSSFSCHSHISEESRLCSQSLTELFACDMYFLGEAVAHKALQAIWLTPWLLTALEKGRLMLIYHTGIILWTAWVCCLEHVLIWFNADLCVWHCEEYREAFVCWATRCCFPMNGVSKEGWEKVLPWAPPEQRPFIWVPV